METLTTAFQHLIKEAMPNAKEAVKVTEDTVYQKGNAEIRALLDKLVHYVALPGSGISGMEHLRELFAHLKNGKPCLLLVEHYSNLDLSLVDSLLRREEGGEKIADALVAIAGMKLTEDNPIVATFASAYSRIIIYPSRALQGLDPEKDKDEIARSAAINRAAIHTLIRVKEKGGLILVFPSGTRYRPGDPSTKRGVREIDSYIRLFAYMCPVAINARVLTINPDNMMDDAVHKDIVRLTVGPVQSCGAFRKKIQEKAEEAGIEDKKQAVVDAVMEMLEELHNNAELERQKLLK